MPELWFRGEAIDVPPATPGSTAPHDIGDGMYLTDNQASAKQYAELRTSDAAKQRVYSVRIDRSGLRVLDLMQDARWREFVKPVEPVLKTGQLNETYGRTFENFIKHFKIDLSKYDAVIGHDYVRGGKQMSILHQGGKPTRLHVMVRRMFQPVNHAIRAGRANVVRLRNWVPRINLSGRGVRFVGNLGIMIIASLIGGWLQARWEKEKIEDGLAKIDPQVRQAVDKKTAEIAWHQLRLEDGEKIYAVATVEIHFGEPYTPLTRKYDALGNRIEYPYSGAPSVWLASLEITTRKLEYEQTERMFGGRIERSAHAFEVQVYTDEEMAIFNELTAEYLSYKRRLMIEPANAIFIEEERRLREQITLGFGADQWFFWDVTASLVK